MINAATGVKEVAWKDVKVWVNELFSINGKELNRENLNELKHILTAHKDKKYYTFHTNEQQEIVVLFSLGEVKIRLAERTLEVAVDETTKRNIYNLRTNHIELEQLNSRPAMKVEVASESESEMPKSENGVAVDFQNDAFNELAEFSEESFA